MNKKFRCIIIVDQDKIHEQEIPFLNRFEKQNISFKYLMNEKQIFIANKLYEKCVQMVTYDENKIKLINYEINNLLINCDEEEILGFVFVETQGKKDIKEEDYEIIENKFISKLAVILPQDIILILLINKNNFDENEENKKFYNKLLDYYNNHIYNNIKGFLSNYESKNNKIVIYTFTKIIESIKKEYLFSYNIKSLGELEPKNIKQIRISSLQNELELETEIEDFLENKNLKILILKLLPFECSTIDYLKTIIENKEKEYDNNKGQEEFNKLFIFLVHLERINKIDLENQSKDNLELIRKKLLTRTLSNLSGYTQILIDDINGQYYFDSENKIITLDKMIKMKNCEIYKAFINLETIFLENLNSILCYFDYSFNEDENEINKDIYINKLINLFIQDKHLLNLIDEKIMENINQKDSDNNKAQNLLEKIIKEEKFSKGDICIYDIVKKVLSKNYLNEFNKLYIELENNYYFSSLLFGSKKILNNNENDIELNKKIKEIFIKDVNLKNKIPEKEMKFEISLGFNLPSKNLIEEIISKINNNIVNKYRQNEEDFKNRYFEHKEEFEEGKQQYENNLELYNKNAKDIIIQNNNIIKEIETILPEGEKNKFYNLLFEDYLFTFINKNLNLQKLKLINSIKPLMRTILENKFNFNENNINLENFCTRLNWIESYSMEITSIIKMFIFLNSFKIEEDLNSRIKEKIKELNEEYNNFKLPENIKIINRIFYIIIGSLINLLISDLNKILSEIKDQQRHNDLLDNLNNLYYSLLSNNNGLNLSCKEIHLLHETIKIISILSFDDIKEEIENNKKIIVDFIQKKIINKKKDEKDLKDKIKKQKLKNENEINNDNDQEEKETEDEKYLKNNLNNFYNYYKEKNNINYANLFSSVLFDEFNKEYNEKYRQYILKTILNDDNLIPYNLLLIKIILSEYVKPEKEYITDALDYISGEETYLPLLNDCNKEIIEKFIIKIFDSIINLYFNSFEKLEENIISDLFDIFKEYLKVIGDKDYEKYYDNYCNEKLVKLYALSFIKIYLNRFANLICDKKSSLKGNENKIIEEINKESSISKTLQLYFIILLFNKNNSLDILNDELFKNIENYVNNLKNEIGQDKLDNILKKLSVPKEDKYLFNEYFNYIKYPSLEDFIFKFKSSNDNQEKFPLLNEYIKNDTGPKNLKYLEDYNNFINLMISYYSGKISRNEANNEGKSLNLEEIYKNNEFNFQEKFDKFKDIWNNNLSQYLINENKNNKISEKFLPQFKGNERLAYFLNDNNENGYGIFIAKGLNKFIEWQNSFLNPIINAYKSRKNNMLSCYISQIEKSVNVQEANNMQILQIEKCFEKTYFNNFIELISLYCQRNNDDINDFNYNFEKIEEELGKSLLPNKCLFNEKNIKYICYQNEGFRNVNYDYLIKFGKKYGEKEPTEENKKNIFIYAKKEYNNFDILYDSFILLVNYLNNNYSEKKGTKIIDFINKAQKKYINFSNQFINYFNEEGKDITIETLLNSFLYLEHLCYEYLINDIDIKFKSTLDKSQKEEIIKYFNNEHKDKIITKKEISSAVRRFIIRYLLNDAKKENIDPNTNLYICLERKYLWNNSIFSSIGDNFADLIKQYLGKFSLKVRHSLEFYNIISDEEKKFLKEEKEKFAGKETKPDNNLKIEEPPKLNPTVLGMGGIKQTKKGGKMKIKK